MVNHHIEIYCSSYSATQPQCIDTMHDLIYSTLANLPAFPFTIVLLALPYLAPTIVGFTAMITLVLYSLELVSTPSPYLGQLAKGCADYLGARLDSVQHHSLAIILRLFLKSNHAMVAVIFGLALCPNIVGSALIATLGLATVLDAVVYLPLAAALPMIGWKISKTVYPFIRDFTLLPFVVTYLLACAMVRSICQAYEHANSTISYHRQSKSARFYQTCMTSQHCRLGEWNCQAPAHWPNPSGSPHPLWSDYQSVEFPIAARIPYWGDRVVYFRSPHHVPQLLELDWTMCNGANRHLYLTPRDVEYERMTGCTLPLQQTAWARSPIY